MSLDLEFNEVSAPVPSTSTLRPVLPQHAIDQANADLADADPQTILEWAIHNVPGLWQTTAFGLTGLAATDMISKISQRLAKAGSPPKHLVPMIFIDTLYHFPETLALADQVSRKYGVSLKVFTPPKASTTAEFEAEYGTELWKSDEETYDYLVKVRLSFLVPLCLGSHTCSGRTSQSRIRATQRRSSLHRQAAIPRRRPFFHQHHRRRLYRSAQNQPASQLVFPASQVLYRRKSRAVQHFARSRI